MQHSEGEPHACGTHTHLFDADGEDEHAGGGDHGPHVAVEGAGKQGDVCGRRPCLRLPQKLTRCVAALDVRLLHTRGRNYRRWEACAGGPIRTVEVGTNFLGCTVEAGRLVMSCTPSTRESGGGHNHSEGEGRRGTKGARAHLLTGCTCPHFLPHKLPLTTSIAACTLTQAVYLQ